MKYTLQLVEKLIKSRIELINFSFWTTFKTKRSESSDSLKQAWSSEFVCNHDKKLKIYKVPVFIQTLIVLAMRASFFLYFDLCFLYNLSM